MSEVEEVAEGAFRRLVSEKSYRSITVKEICERAFISRRTFYVNFTCKQDVVSAIFRRDAIEPISRILDMLSMDEAASMAPAIVGRFYRSIYDQRSYYSALVSSIGKEATFRQVVAAEVSRLIAWSAERYGLLLEDDELRVASCYYANAEAALIEDWIANGFDIPVDRLAQLHESAVWKQGMRRATVA